MELRHNRVTQSPDATQPSSDGVQEKFNKKLIDLKEEIQSFIKTTNEEPIIRTEIKILLEPINKQLNRDKELKDKRFLIYSRNLRGYHSV